MKVCPSSQASPQGGNEKLFGVDAIPTFIHVNNCIYSVIAYYARTLGPVPCVFRIVTKSMDAGLRRGLEYRLEFTLELLCPWNN